MRKKYKKDNPSIEVAISLLIGGGTILKTHNLNNGVVIFIISLFIIYCLSFTISNIKSKKYKNMLLNSGIDIVDKMKGEEFEKRKVW